MFKWISGLLDRIFAVAGALLLAQAPMFIQQYTHQLSGHVYELKFQMSAIRHSAESSGKTIPEYIQKFIGSGDSDFTRQGKLMQEMVERTNSLSAAFQDITTASIFSKPFVFVRNLDWAIVKDTYTHFQFGIPFTVEGLVYAIVGIIFGFVLFQILSRLFISFYLLIKDPKKA